MGWHIRWSKLLVAAGILLVVAPAAAMAQSDTVLAGKFRAGDDITIGPEETVEDDLYVAAGTVRVAGTVNGDLIVSGGQIDIGGRVNGDLIVGGGTVSVDGDIGGDARVGAGQLRVAGTIAEDLVVGTGTLAVESPAEISGDIVFSSGQTVVDGTVGGNVLGSTGEYDAAGQVGGTEDVTIAERGVPTVTQRIWSAVRRWVSLVLVAALLLWLVPAVVRRSHDTVRADALPAAGAGIVGVVAIPLALALGVIVTILVAVALGVVALGQLAGTVLATGLITVAAGAMVFVFLVLFVAQVIVSLLIGGLIQQPQGRRGQLVAAAIGALPLVVLFALPVVGGVIQFVVVVLGLGALILALWHMRRRAPDQSHGPDQPDAAAAAA
jgi:hypothetical protein